MSTIGSQCGLAVLLAFTWLASGRAPGRGTASDRGQTEAGWEYDRAEAEAAGAARLARREFGVASVEAATATDALVSAQIRNGRAWSTESRNMAETTLALKETLLGRQHVLLVPSLVNAGDVLVAHAAYADGIAALERAVALSDFAHPAGALSAAEALDRLGLALVAGGRHEESFQILERSLAVKERLSPSAAGAIGRTLEALGTAAQAAGQYVRARGYIQRAIESQSTTASDGPQHVETLNLLAQQLWLEGRLLESARRSEQAVTLADRVLRPTHPSRLEAVRYLAATLSDLGDLSRSRALRADALALAEGEFGADQVETVKYLNSLAMAEGQLGGYLSARSLYERALTAASTRYGPHHDAVATLRLNLAIVHFKLGDYRRARQEHAAAVSIWERLGGRNHPFVALALNELAGVSIQEGRPREALPLLERALAIREANLGPSHPDVARTLGQLAATLSAIGRLERAQRLATRALLIWEQNDTPDAPEYATVLALYADLQFRRGDYASARDFYARALAIRVKVFGDANPLSAETQVGLASALAQLGEAGALEAAVRAEEVGREHLRLMLRSLPERQALQYAATRPRGLDLMLSLASALPRAAPAAVDGLVRSRALVLDEIGARRTMGRPGDGDDATRMALTAAQQRLANRLVRGPAAMSPEQYASLIESARTQAETAEQTLAEQSADFRAERSRAQIGAEDVLTVLPSDSALVSFARYDRTVLPGAATTAAGPSRAPPRVVPSYVAFVLRRDRPPAVVPVGSVQAIDRLVAQWRVDLAAEAVPAPASMAEPTSAFRASGLALRARVWDPLASHLGDARRVFVVPDGSLSLVPFAALPVGQRSYLLDRGPIIHYLSAERDIVPAPDTRSATGGLLAIGGPSFDDNRVFSARPRQTAPSTTTPVDATLRAAPMPCGGLQSVTFQPLAGTMQEVRDLSALWPADAGQTQLLVGRDASETAFKREAGGHRVLHLATHGFFLNGDCAPASSGTRGVGGLTSADGRPIENPLLLSGLALAGANRRAAAGPDEDDGILTAEEVASLDLSGVEWAVLSACDTGIGEIRAGEGVFGLRRAFQVAGARTVVMSLWSVDDLATRAWMRSLYEGRFQRKLSTAEAVHEASLSVLRDRRASGLSTHPFYWAAFVAAGDWR